jgi:hypothetical protein
MTGCMRECSYISHIESRSNGICPSVAIAAIDTAKHSNFDAGTGAALVFFVSLFLAASTLGPGVAGQSMSFATQEDL